MISKYAVRYCKDDISKIENYDKAIADTTQTWYCHHRTEIWWNCTKQDLIDNECYYGRKACELIFLTQAEHNRLHREGKTLTEEHRRKISESHKGKTSSIFGAAFYEHYGLTKGDDKNLYMKEYVFYKRHNKFRWEQH